MTYQRVTFERFMDHAQHSGGLDRGLCALLDDLQRACKQIAWHVARGALLGGAHAQGRRNIHGEDQKPLDLLTQKIIVKSCEWGGHLCGMVSEEMDEPYTIPADYRRGPYLLVFDPLDGSANAEINGTMGTIFSILRAPAGLAEPTASAFLQPGRQQAAAGFALYGPTSMLILTLGDGVHGFTLDRESGALVLTHPNIRVAAATREFAINASNERFWEPPVRRYVAECVEGKDGPRGADFNMRWIASMVAEVHRILMRGGIFMYPHDSKQPLKAGRLRLLYEANPMAMLIEQAGGAATTGRERILDVQPTDIHQRIPVILGSQEEVERVARYHAAYDRGEDLVLDTPLFRQRTIFRPDYELPRVPACP